MALENDLVYLKILLASIAMCFLVKRCPQKNVLCAMIGLFMVAIVCGKQLLYSLFIVVVNIVLINCFSKYAHILSFGACFAYLAFFRCSDMFGFEKFLPYANAVQLIMTLRCVGLAFEVKDASHENKENKIKCHVMRGIDQFCYCYNFIGLFTGPYFSKKTHEDMCDFPFSLQINYGVTLIRRVYLVPVYIVAYLILQNIFSLEEMKTDAFYDNYGFLARIFWTVPIFIQLRMRCYVAWSLSEAACMITGLGAYPKLLQSKCGAGPSVKIDKRFSTEQDVAETDFDFETISNIDPYGCEFSPTVREAMRCWNKTVQYWLAVTVYKRSPRSVRTATTMLVSAYWHGVYAGYFLSFLTIPVCLAAEDSMYAYCKDLKPNKKRILNAVWWFFRVRALEYMCAGFLLLEWSHTTRYWSSVYYLPHLFLFSVSFVCHFLNDFKKRND